MNQQIPCPICGGNEFRILSERTIRTKYHVFFVECQGCQFVFQNPVTKEQLLRKFIFEEYYKSKKIGKEVDRSFIRHFTRRAKGHLAIIKKFFPPGFRGSVLDVGCAAGFFLKEMKKVSWKVRGIEPDKNCHEYANDILRISVERCLFRDFNTNKKFDLIYFSHSFDDLSEIDDVLIRVKSLLDSDGRLFIEVPNFNRYANFKRVRGEDFLESKYYFTPVSLSKLLRKHCFSILYLKTKEPVYLNSLGQCLISPIKIIKKLIPANRKSHIRIIAEVTKKKFNSRESNSSFHAQAF